VQHILYRLKIKPGMMDKFKECCAVFESRRAECDASLIGEGADAEAFFFVGEDEVFVSKRLRDYAAMKHYQKTSGAPIYEQVKVLNECIAEQSEYSSFLSFDILK